MFMCREQGKALGLWTKEFVAVSHFLPEQCLLRGLGGIPDRDGVLVLSVHSLKDRDMGCRRLAVR